MNKKLATSLIVLVLVMLLMIPTSVSAAKIQRVEETDASFVWSGTWLSEENPGASGGTWKVTKYSTVNSVDITFTGIGITLITAGGPNCGIMKVKIDGKSYPDINMYYPSNTRVTKTIATNLTNTQHVLTISPSETKNPKSTDTVILVDAVDTTAPTPITGDLVDKIAFVSDRDSDFEIYVMDADGTNVVQLTNNVVYDSAPAWSPDCKKIAFHSDRDGDKEIYVMNGDGTNVTQLTSNTASDGRPAWSPNGCKIAFHSDRDGDKEIYVMNGDGTNVTQLTSNTASDKRPAWSSNGSKIAFQSDRDGDFEIYVMDADGTNVVQLTNNTADDWLPAWSPDGKKIAFSSDRDGDLEIYVMNADGTNVTQLTSNTVWECFPAWSRDGRKIAFSSDRDGEPEIYVMNTDGTNVTQLTINTAWDRSPDWCSLQLWDPWIYNTNGNGIIEKNEAGNAAKDYFEKKITMEHALEVLLLHFATQP